MFKGPGSKNIVFYGIFTNIINKDPKFLYAYIKRAEVFVTKVDI